MKWQRETDTDGDADYQSGEYSVSWTWSGFTRRGRPGGRRDWTAEYRGKQIGPIVRTMKEAKTMCERHAEDEAGKAAGKPRYAIGTRFCTQGKAKRRCIVVDILTTTNSKGEVVETRYVATNEFMGQTITDRGVLETTIARGLEP